MTQPVDIPFQERYAVPIIILCSMVPATLFAAALGPQIFDDIVSFSAKDTNAKKTIVIFMLSFASLSALGFTTCLLYIYVDNWKKLLYGLRAYRWPTVQGKFLPTPRKLFHIWVHYEYTVDEITYKKKCGIRGLAMSHDQRIDFAVNGIVSPIPISVRYDPENPKAATLQSGVPLHTWLTLIMLPVMLVVPTLVSLMLLCYILMLAFSN